MAIILISLALPLLPLSFEISGFWAVLPIAVVLFGFSIILFLDNLDKHARPHLPCSSHVLRTLANTRTTLQFLAGLFGPWNDGVLLDGQNIKLAFGAFLGDTSIGSISFGFWSCLLFSY